MSWEAQAWVWTLDDLTPMEKLVALAMANYADVWGENIFPGQALIEADTRAAAATVRRTRDSLVEKGVLVLVRRSTGRGNANEYSMPVDMDRVAEHHRNKRAARDASTVTRETKGAISVKGAIGDVKGAIGHPAGQIKGAIRTHKEGSGDTPPLLEPLGTKEPKKDTNQRARAREGVVDCLEGFEDWFRLYPLPKDKGHARKAYAKAVRAGNTPADLISALRKYPFDLSRRDYIPFPATWLNGERWADAPEPPKAEGMNSGMRYLAEISGFIPPQPPLWPDPDPAEDRGRTIDGEVAR